MIYHLGIDLFNIYEDYTLIIILTTNMFLYIILYIFEKSS